MAEFPVNINRFYGMVPRFADEHLLEGQVTAATLAINCRYESGTLTAYRANTYVDDIGQQENVATVFGVDVRGGFPYVGAWIKRLWFTWNEPTDVVVGTENDDKFAYNGQFFYMSDGVKPMMTYGDIALDAAGGRLGSVVNNSRNIPLPLFLEDTGQPRRGGYRLGLPKPEGKVSSEVQQFTTKRSEWFERDESGFSTIRTTQPHGLQTGDIVTISDFGGSTIDNPIDWTPPADTPSNDGGDDTTIEP